jgi:hypothetical protein
VRSVSSKIGTGDFISAAGHRRIAVSLLACTLNSAAAFSIAVTSSAASTAQPYRLARELVDAPACWLRRFRSLRHGGSIGRKECSANKKNVDTSGADLVYAQPHPLVSGRW